MTRSVFRAGVDMVVVCGALAALSCGHEVPTRPTAQPTTSQVATTVGPPFVLHGTVATATGSSLPGATIRATWASGSVSALSQGAMGSAYILTVPYAGDVTVRAEMAGYDAQERTLTVTANVAGIDFALLRTLPSEQYRLTFTASPSCSLPAEVSSRQYTAGLSTDASQRVTVYLRAQMMLAFCGEAGFTGVRVGDAVRFDVSDDEMASYAFVEFLPGYRWLSYSGSLTGRIVEDRIEGTFNGLVRLAEGGGATIAECRAADHRMEFVRIAAQ